MQLVCLPINILKTFISVSISHMFICVLTLTGYSGSHAVQALDERRMKKCCKPVLNFVNHTPTLYFVTSPLKYYWLTYLQISISHSADEAGFHITFIYMWEYCETLSQLVSYGWVLFTHLTSCHMLACALSTPIIVHQYINYDWLWFRICPFCS